jgi:hypothetical protein
MDVAAVKHRPQETRFCILEDEFNHSRPMLGALAVGVSGLPGPGLFRLARELGKLHNNSMDAERDFWEQEWATVQALETAGARPTAIQSRPSDH